MWIVITKIDGSTEKLIMPEGSTQEDANLAMDILGGSELVESLELIVGVTELKKTG